jgi:hypothetical protein
MKHGHTRNGKPTSEYTAWYSMIQRCENPNHKKYYLYGNRRITVCKRWHKFENFLKDMGLKPSGLTLERRNNNGNYEPGNCYWATHKEQRNNRRPQKPISKGPSKQYWFYGHGPNGEMIIGNNQHHVAKVFELGFQGNISACLLGKRKQHKGWIFQKI